MDWFEIESLDGRTLFSGSSCLSVPVETESSFANSIHWFGSLSNSRDVRSEFILKPVESDASKVAPIVRDNEDWVETNVIKIWFQFPETRSVNLKSLSMIKMGKKRVVQTGFYISNVDVIYFVLFYSNFMHALKKKIIMIDILNFLSQISI